MGRIWQLDAARGVAIGMMLLSNFLFDLALFRDCEWCYQGFWLWFAHLTAILFLFIAGASAGLGGKTVRARLKSGFLLLGLGGLITLATWSVVGEELVLFGILHLIGLSRLLVIPLKRKPIALAIGLGILALTVLGVTAPSEWLLWLAPYPRLSVDYTPLLPWAAFFFLGYGISEFLPAASKSRAPPLEWIGRHSLLIYLVHQPVLVGVIWLVHALV